MRVFLKYLIIFAKICNMCGIVCALDIKKLQDEIDMLKYGPSGVVGIY